jgi:PHS family inorganic phosphate transporter-like MFS transporter
MQPLGQLLAYLVGLGALKGISHNYELDPNMTDYEVAAPGIDFVWRCVIGVGAIPAFLTITARYILLVE